MKRAMLSLIAAGLIGICPMLPAAGQERPAPPRADRTGLEKPWPRSYTAPSGAIIVIYQPQIARWDNQKHIVSYAAVSYLPGGAETREFGTLKVEGDTAVSPTERLVKFTNLKITEASFQSLSKEQTAEIVTEIERTIPEEDGVMALDRVLASVDKSNIVPRNVVGVKADTPRVFFSKTPAILLNIDGNPVWSPIRDNDLKFAVNTNWDLFQHGPTGTYYLRNEDTWLKAPDVKGPWTAADKLPGSFKKLPDDENWKEVRESVKFRKTEQVPTVFVSTQPGELIVLQGEPKYLPVSGTGTKLLWVSNTESDLFRMGETGTVYYLVAGRWFSAPDFTGPWTFATPNLPPDFKMIPLEHPRSRVLASVPGTEQAAEAVLFAEVPETARVNKKQKAPEVIYNGNPEFAQIEGTSLQRATNTDKEIIKVGDIYYMCFDGVWFMGTSPNGPWSVTSSVPGEIYEIPVSSPAHHLTYVRAYDEGDDWVEFATLAGYTGLMLAWGTAVWGSGWDYPSYYGWWPWGWGGYYYPAYYPYLRTYGWGGWYNPWTGYYWHGGRHYGPYGGWYGGRYDPHHNRYDRGSVAWGDRRYRGGSQLWNPRSGTYGDSRRGSGVYGRWDSSRVRRGDQWAQPRRGTGPGGTTTRGARFEGGRRTTEGAGFGRRGDRNVYAGRDGNVYRRDQSGNWSRWQNGGWNRVSKPDRTPSAAGRMPDRTARPSTTPRPQMDRSTFNRLQRDYGARSDGARRTRDFNSYRSGGGGNAGSFRGSGSTGARVGGSRSGGTFRGGAGTFRGGTGTFRGSSGGFRGGAPRGGAPRGAGGGRRR